MLTANSRTNAYLFHASQHMLSDILAARPIAEIFTQHLFVTVRAHDSCLNIHARHVNNRCSQMLSPGL